MPKIAIGLVGPIASGKGTVIKILSEKEYSSYSLSDRIREEIKSRGMEITRDTLNTVSNELRENIGTDVWAKRTAELIEKENPEFVVIDAIRNPAEISYLKEKLGIKIIGIIANQARRYEWFHARTTNTAGVSTWEEFKELDDKELKQTGDHKQQVAECLELADIIIDNNGTIEDLKHKVEDYVQTLSSS